MSRTVNGVTVADELKHLLPVQRKQTEDLKAQIMHFIEARPKEALTNADFQELLGTTSAMAHIKKLMKQGYITRQRVYKGRGKRYSYKWHSEPLDYETAARKNGIVLTRDLNLPEFKLRGLLEDLDKLAFEWQETMPRPINGDYIVGVIEFRKWLKVKEKEVEDRRKAIINEHSTSGRAAAVGVATQEPTTPESE